MADIAKKTGQTINYYAEKSSPVVKVITRKFPILGILTIIFVIAKIFDKLDCSWFVVFWPLWITPAIILSVLCLIACGVLCMVLYWLCEDAWKWLKRKFKKKKCC